MRSSTAGTSSGSSGVISIGSPRPESTDVVYELPCGSSGVDCVRDASADDEDVPSWDGVDDVVGGVETAGDGHGQPRPGADSMCLFEWVVPGHSEVDVGRDAEAVDTDAFHGLHPGPVEPAVRDVEQEWYA